MSRTRLFLIAASTICMAGCASSRFDATAKIAPAAMQKDVALAWKTYDQCHPSIDWYAPYDSVKNAFETLRLSLTDSLTEQQFRFQLGKALASIRCGHTSVRPSKAAAAAGRQPTEPYFPLQLKCWGTDSMVVMSNAFRNDSTLLRGTVITAIDQFTSKQILDSLVQFIPADGYQYGLRLQIISNNFPAYYRLVFGKKESHTIQYINKQGLSQQTTVYNFAPRRDSARRDFRRQADSVARTRPDQQLPKHYRQRHLSIDTARSLAVMELNTFSPAALQSFFRQSFKSMRKLHLKNLVIDLRENGGGNIVNSTRLTKYLVKAPFKVCDTMAAKSVSYPSEVKVEWGFIYQLERFFAGKRRADGRIHFVHYEKELMHPKKKNHFDGDVYLITGSQTFSASTLFISPLQAQPNITIVGEETGGGSYGNTSVHIPDVTLPNTGVRIRLPLYRLVICKDIPNDGRGIMPVIAVPPSSYHLANRTDPKMLKVYEMLAAKMK